MAIAHDSRDSENLKYGVIAGNRRINAMIYRCFEHTSEKDEQKFVKKFREQPDDSSQIMHTFMELVLGAYLSSSGLRVSYDHKVKAKTPDWCILNEKSAVIGIVELMNFHIDKATENEIEEQLRAGGLALVWRDKNKNNVDRLYHRIWHKAQTYKALVEELKVPYVVAVFGDFQVAVDWDDLCLCLFDEESGFFEMYPEVSGVLYFEESSGQYVFNYVHNPSALQLANLPSGVFPSGQASSSAFSFSQLGRYPVNREELLLEQWKLASRLHQHTDNLAWQTFNFFIATNGLLLTIFGAIIISDAFKQGGLFPLITVTAIPLVGIITSLLWSIIQTRQQLYQYYRAAQARQAEEALKIDGQRVLTLYEKNINEQDLISVPKFRRYLKSPIGKWRAHTLVVVLALSLAIVWLSLLAVALRHW